jgi:hypothetical protein
VSERIGGYSEEEAEKLIIFAKELNVAKFLYPRRDYLKEGNAIVIRILPECIDFAHNWHTFDALMGRVANMFNELYDAGFTIELKELIETPGTIKDDEARNRKFAKGLDDQGEVLV